jgi:hypothetical protein
LLNRLLTASCLIVFAAPLVFGQATSTASRRADLQLGGGFVLDDKSDYEVNAIKGGAIYTTLDLTNHLGGEFVIHQANSFSGDGLYERTYEIGPRYFRTYGRFSPYIKFMVGRGVFNFPKAIGAPNLAYNMFAFGGGLDYRVLPYLNVRFDYEYQDWSSFPPTGLTPQLYTVGVAYHFPGNLRRSQHF